MIEICKAFSCIISRVGTVTWKLGIDSHDDLIKNAGYKDDTDDKNRLEFARVEITPDNGDYLNPDKWTLRIDEQIRPSWWTEEHEKKGFLAFQKWKKQLDKIIVHKPIIHPFQVIPLPDHVDPMFLNLLIEWNSVWKSVWDSVWKSVRDSVWDSVGDSVEDSVWKSVWNSVRDSVWNSVWKSVWNSVWNSVGDSVWDSVWNSVGDSAWAYTGSFFLLNRSGWKYCENIGCSGYPFEPLVKLWEMGIVPSFDGKIWRLHIGPNATILWKGTIEDAKEQIILKET